MITKNQEVVEELKKKQSEEFQEKSDHLEDGSYQETKEKTKSLSADKKKKIKKKATAPAQKKTGFFAYFTEKWKGIFSSENKENKTNGKEESLKKESDKIVEFSKKKVKTQLSKGEQKQIKRKIQQMKAALSKRLKEEEINDDAIYEAEKPLMEDFKKVKLSKAEEHAIGRYTAGGYLDINRYLRNPQANALYEAKDLAINVRNVTQRAVVSKDTTVIRNIRPDALHLVFGRSKPYETVEEAYMELSRKTEKSKMVFREKGICSTTICPRGAIGFNTFPVEMRILVPKGSHGLYLEHTKMCMDGERELILAPDTDFQLIGVEKDVWRENYIAVDTDNRNMGDTKLIMYLTVLPKKTEAEQRAA